MSVSKGTKRKSGWSSLIKKVTETNASPPYKNSVLQMSSNNSKDLDTLIDMNGFPTPMSAPLVTDEAAYQELVSNCTKQATHCSLFKLEISHIFRNILKASFFQVRKITSFKRAKHTFIDMDSG